MRQAYVPVNLSDTINHGQEDIEQSQQSQQISYVTPIQTATTKDGQPILLAVAVPNTIRPPKVSYSEDDVSANATITPKSMLRRVCILIVGLFLTYITFFESLLLLLNGAITKNWFEIILGFLWFAATLALLVGSFVGAYRGQWRILVPGFVLQHICSILIRLFVTDIDDRDGAYSGYYN
jgi:hypothetical protein